ncbi:MAG TPA: riboflavin synthase, partial [Turneriella sp.]|nr:riboflavin synthase [Turneriella sp.]
MFTGLIEEVGEITQIIPEGKGTRFTIYCKEILNDMRRGDSIAVSGACQTVEAFDTNYFQIFSIPETLLVTNFKNFRQGSFVNLERALRLGDRLGGHLVQGHVEGVAQVLERNDGDAVNIILKYPSPYIIEKGSVCVDGMSMGRNLYANE